MLKTTGLPDKPATGRNKDSRSASSRNNNNKLFSRKINGNSKFNGFGIDADNMEHVKKLRKPKGKKSTKF